MDNNIKYSRKEMEERLPDYIFGKLEQDERNIFEQNLQFYPDLVKEIKDVSEVFAKVQKIDFNKIAEVESSNMSERVLRRIRIQDKSKSTYNYARGNTMRYLIPSLAAMLLIVIATQFIIWNQTKQQISQNNQVVEELFDTQTPKVLELSPKDKAALDKSTAAITTPLLTENNMSIINNNAEINVLIDAMYAEFVDNILDGLSNHQIEKVASTVIYGNNYLQDLQDIDEENLQNILNEVDNAEFIF